LKEVNKKIYCERIFEKINCSDHGQKSAEQYKFSTDAAKTRIVHTVGKRIQKAVETHFTQRDKTSRR